MVNTIQPIDIALRIASVALSFGETNRATQHPDGRAETRRTR